MLEKILYKFWFIRISKAKFFINKYDEDILKWAKEDFWVDKSKNHNTLEAFDDYLRFAYKLKYDELHKLYK